MQVLILCEQGLKTPIDAPRIVFFGGGDKIGEGVLRCLPNKIVLTFGSCYLCAAFRENRSRNATLRVRTDRRTDIRTDRDKLSL